MHSLQVMLGLNIKVITQIKREDDFTLIHIKKMLMI
jgi:hypothetical protein